MDVNYLIQRECLRRGLSRKTIKTYCGCVRKFFGFCHKEPRKVTKKDVRLFLDKFIEKDAPGNTINVYLNALKFLFENILNKKLFLKIKYSKIPKSLPLVLTKEEVLKILDSIGNEKHKLMIKLMYSAGLRVSELVHLKVCDLQLDKNYGWVRKGKGRKDRMFIIAQSLKEELLSLVSDLEYGSYLFKGRCGHITVRTVQEIIKKSVKKAGLEKKAHPHTLRHSFATHLIENGYDLNSVQNLLGHASPETTMIYVHMASPNMINVKSPLDCL
ncbi:site-specific tyrosine recombinase/integron integrase [Nanoarchaeota archaeon]